MIKTSLAIIFSIIASAPLYAAAPPETGARTVVLADLNLASAAGRAQLQRRIDRAVTSVCGRIVHTELRAANDVRRCRAEARDAVAALPTIRAASLSFADAR